MGQPLNDSIRVTITHTQIELGRTAATPEIMAAILSAQQPQNSGGGRLDSSPFAALQSIDEPVAQPQPVSAPQHLLPPAGSPAAGANYHNILPPSPQPPPQQAAGASGTGEKQRPSPQTAQAQVLPRRRFGLGFLLPKLPRFIRFTLVRNIGLLMLPTVAAAGFLFLLASMPVEVRIDDEAPELPSGEDLPESEGEILPGPEGELLPESDGEA